MVSCVQGQKLSLGGAFSAGTLVSSVGKWLDRGLTAMMGGGSDAGEPGTWLLLPSCAGQCKFRPHWGGCSRFVLPLY
jgi:hypothetical protein